MLSDPGHLREFTPSAFWCSAQFSSHRRCVGGGIPYRPLARLHAASPSAHERLALARGHPAGLLLREHASCTEPLPRLPSKHQLHAARSAASALALQVRDAQGEMDAREPRRTSRRHGARAVRDLEKGGGGCPRRSLCKTSDEGDQRPPGGAGGRVLGSARASVATEEDTHRRPMRDKR
jgi:hypothetical protein